MAEVEAAESPQEVVRTRQRWLTVGIILFALYVAKAFLTPIAWAAVLALSLWPLYARAVRRFPGRETLIAFGFAVATAVLVMIPIAIVAASAVQESQDALGWVQGVQRTGLPVPGWLGGVPLVGGRLQAFWQSHVGSPRAAAELLGGINAGAVFGYTRTAAGQVANAAVLFLITLVMLVAMLARGRELARELQRASDRLLGTFGGHFLERLGEAVRGTVVGTVLVAAGEGSLIGIGYWVAGVPRPLLFAVLTIFVATLPFGAWFAFGIATLILVIQGHLLAAGLLFGFSIVVMLVGDNVAQPALIGSSVKLPFVMALLGVFGGLETFGLVGLFIGPAIMAAVLLVWRQWTDADPGPPARPAEEARVGPEVAA
ncbi:AI-2E family transporter [Sphingomonas sp.]|uniref:AI-2E family transporter n=1 Tax=Sphingomonas sp. TaxID=28214 RepID=UPI003CC6A271